MRPEHTHKLKGCRLLQSVQALCQNINVGTQPAQAAQPRATRQRWHQVIVACRPPWDVQVASLQAGEAGQLGGRNQISLDQHLQQACRRGTAMDARNPCSTSTNTLVALQQYARWQEGSNH